MRLFHKSQLDVRKLSMLAHQVARQHPSRREWVHGSVKGMSYRASERIHEAFCKCPKCKRVA